MHLFQCIILNAPKMCACVYAFSLFVVKYVDKWIKTNKISSIDFIAFEATTKIIIREKKNWIAFNECSKMMLNQCKLWCNVSALFINALYIVVEKQPVKVDSSTFGHTHKVQIQINRTYVTILWNIFPSLTFQARRISFCFEFYFAVCDVIFCYCCLSNRVCVCVCALASK